MTSSLREPILWKHADLKRLRSIQGICFDIDDTFSSHGKISAEAFNALWNLWKAGFILVPVTGRPAGWCDHIARFWPVHAIIGENGAFTFFMQNGVRSRIETLPGFDPAEGRRKLNALGEKIRAAYPHAQWASDQAYREYDLAIDFCEDVEPWDSFEVDSLVTLCKENGAHAKVSSIHVNTWFGDYDKISGIRRWLDSGAPGLNRPNVPSWDQWIYIGDSPNDEPAFAAFDHSVGVANIEPFLDQLTARPTWITDYKSGDGFVQFAEMLLRAQAPSITPT